MYEWPQKSTQACQAFHTYFIGFTYWSTQPVLAGWRVRCGHKVQALIFKLNIPFQRWNFLTFHKTIQGAFWCVNYLVTWLDVFAGSMFLKVLRSYVSFTPPPPKQSTSAQNPTSYTGLFQPGARLFIINTISRPLELRLLNFKESVIRLKMTRVYTVSVNKTNKCPNIFLGRSTQLLIKLLVLYVRIKMKQSHKESIFSGLYWEDRQRKSITKARTVN